MPKVVRCPNCHGPLPIDPKAPVLQCPYCHADVKQTIALAPPEPEPPQKQVVIEKKIVVISPSPEAVRRAGRGVGCAITFTTLLIVAVSAGIPLWQSGVLKSVVGGVKSVVKSDPEPAEAQKLAAYVDLHAAASSLRDSYQRYRSWQESPAGPTCHERHIYGLYEVHLHSIDRGQKAIGEEPKLPELDPAVERFSTVLRAGAATFNEARRYYDQRDYKDDGCAKAKTLHVAIEAAHGRVLEEEQALGALLEKQIGGFLSRRLARWSKEQPGGASATAIQTLIHARELALEIDRLEQAGVAEAEGSAPSPRPEKKDTEGVWSRIRALEGSLEAAVAAAPDSSDRRSSVTWPYTMRTHFKNRLDKLLKQAKAYARAPSPATMSPALEAWNDTVGWAGWAGPKLPSTQHPRRRIGRRVALEPGAPIAAAGLPVELVRRVVAAHKNGLVRCVRGATDRIVLKFSVGKAGRVTAAELTEPATLAAPARRCLEAAVRRWVFPATGNEFTITYPIRFL